MLTLLVIRFIIRLMQGGSFFIVPDIKDRVKDLIKEPERLQPMIEAFEAVEEANKAFDKKYEAYGKQVNELMKDRNTPESSFTPVYEAAIEDFKEVQNTIIQGRMIFVQILTPEEFETLTDPTAKKTAKQEEQLEEGIEKTRENMQKKFDDIKTLADEIISDPDRKQEVFTTVQDTQNSLEDLLQELRAWNFSGNEVLKDYNATPAQLRELYDTLNQYRLNLYNTFTHLYVGLSNACTDDEWKKAAKMLKQTSETAG